MWNSMPVGREQYDLILSELIKEKIRRNITQIGALFTTNLTIIFILHLLLKA